MKKIVILACLSILAGCAATGPKMAAIKSSIPAISADQGRIFFYRPDSFVGGAIRPEIRLDEQAVGNSVPGGFFFVDRAPGEHEVAVSTEVTRNTKLYLAPGQKRYIRTAVSMGLLVGRVTPEEVDAAQAESELQSLSYTGSPALLQADTQARTVAYTAPTVAEPVVVAAAQPEKAASAAPAVAARTEPATVAAPATITAAPAPAAAAPLIPAAKPAAATPRTLGPASYTVDKMAREQGCQGDAAWLVKEAANGDSYQVNCADGRVITAVCTSNQCRIGN
ncbi:DUF2846 domain-containing protein [Chitinimonas sp.]|uniref:DUF2846 domain-containing protein n=1 Tax=Chitinimonas sp. TaxID=1934313 RepID=UPI0035AE04CC